MVLAVRLFASAGMRGPEGKKQDVPRSTVLLDKGSSHRLIEKEVGAYARGLLLVRMSTGPTMPGVCTPERVVVIGPIVAHNKRRTGGSLCLRPERKMFECDKEVLTVFLCLSLLTCLCLFSS